MELFIHHTGSFGTLVLSRTIITSVARNFRDLSITLECHSEAVDAWQDLGLPICVYGSPLYTGLKATPNCPKDALFINLAFEAFPDILQIYGFTYECLVHSFNRQMQRHGIRHLLQLPITPQTPLTTFVREQAYVSEPANLVLFEVGQTASGISTSDMLRTAATEFPTLQFRYTGTPLDHSKLPSNCLALPEGTSPLSISALSERCLALVTQGRDIYAATQLEANRDTLQLVIGWDLPLPLWNEGARNTHRIDTSEALIEHLGKVAAHLPENIVSAPTVNETATEITQMAPVVTCSAAKKPHGVFLNQPKAMCSIYESGRMMYEALITSDAFELDYLEVNETNAQQIPLRDFYVFNYHHATMAWLDTKSVSLLPGKKFTFVLEMLPNNPFVLCPKDDFNAYLVLDPTMEVDDRRVYAFPRPLEPAPANLQNNVTHDIPIIGSFGFATPGKGFELVVDAVNREFDRAIVRINIPPSTFADATTHNLQGQFYPDYLANLARSMAKPGIEVQVTNDFMTKEQLIHWCASNTLNCFLYSRNQPGLSATTDQAITSGRPLAVSANDTFRHIHKYIQPYPRLNLRDAIEKSQPAVLQMREDWTPKNFGKKFECVLADYGFLSPSDNKVSNAPIVSRPERKRTLFITDDKQFSGISQYGQVVAEVVKKSKRLLVEHRAVSSLDAFQEAVRSFRPEILIVNYASDYFPWLSPEILQATGAETFALLHGADFAKAESLAQTHFDGCIISDPTRKGSTGGVHFIGRVLPLYCNDRNLPDEVVIGSFGFSRADAGFEKLVDQVQQDFKKATILIHMPVDPINDGDTRVAADIVRRCYARIRRPEIQLQFLHQFLPPEGLLSFLAHNTMNAFFYEDRNEPGISSVLDFALAVQRPLAVTRSNVFRHVHGACPSICIEDNSLAAILKNGIVPLVPYFADWNEASFLARLEDILDGASENTKLTPEITKKKTLPPAQYGIAVFRNIGDVLCCTPIAKQLKQDDPSCTVTWFTSEDGAQCLKGNPFIDQIVVIPLDPLLAEKQIPELRNAIPWTRFFTPAAYMNYDVIPGWDETKPRGNIFGIVKKAANLNWTIPFVFPFQLSPEEVQTARNYWNSLPAGPKVLVESDYRSNQSPWNDEWNFDLPAGMDELSPVFVFTSRKRPEFLDRFLEVYPRAVWCDQPFRLNAEFFNLCDVFIGVSSGISCLTYSDYCVTDKPRVEVTRGEHWGAAPLAHHSELHLCYNRSRFFEALRTVSAKAQRRHLNPLVTPRFPKSTNFGTCCPNCGQKELVPTETSGTVRCTGCELAFTEQEGPADVVLRFANEQALFGQALTHISKSIRSPKVLVLGAADLDPGSAAFEQQSLAHFLQGPIVSQTYDLVFLPRDFVSCHYPQECLERIQEALKPEGICTLAAPNAAGLLLAATGERWNWAKQASRVNSRLLREMFIQAGFVIEEGFTNSGALAREEILRLLQHLDPQASAEVLAKRLTEVEARDGGEAIHLIGRRRGSFKGRVQIVKNETVIITPPEKASSVQGENLGVYSP